MSRAHRPLRLVPGLAGLPGSVRLRSEVPAPAAYAVVDLETTGTSVEADEIVSLAVVRLDADGVELDRFASLVRPAGPIPPEATAVHGIDDAAVAAAPTFAELAPELLALLDGAVFVAHNADFDLPLLEHAFARAGVRYRPVRGRLHARRVPAARARRAEPPPRVALRAARHRRSPTRTTRATTCSRPWSSSASCSTEGIAPETVALDRGAYMRLRSRGDTRPASEPQIRRVFALARAAGLCRPDGAVDADAGRALVARVAGDAAVDELTREQVQEVYDALDRRLAELPAEARAASG